MSFVKKWFGLEKSCKPAIPRTEVGTKFFFASKRWPKQFGPHFVVRVARTLSPWSFGLGAVGQLGGRVCIAITLTQPRPVRYQ